MVILCINQTPETQRPGWAVLRGDKRIKRTWERVALVGLFPVLGKLIQQT